MIREARAGEAAESNIARRGLAAGATGTGEGDATAGAAAGGSAIATGAIAEPGGLCSASPRTACRFGVAAGADERDAEWDQAIAQLRRFPRGEDEADIGEHEPKGADQLHELAVAQVGERLKLAGAGPEPGLGYDPG